MPTHTLSRKDGITFSYLDSGLPSKRNEYSTLIILHGLKFNAGIFERLFPLASEMGLRIVAISRRPYSGSTKYSEAELNIIRHASLEEKSKFWDDQGLNLALLVNELIEVLDLQNVALVGWSLGSIFVLLIINSYSSLDLETRERLVKHVRLAVVWDPPSTVFGFAAPAKAYLPHFDETIPKEERARRFIEYVSSYFTHTDAAYLDADFINYHPDEDKAPSIDGMLAEDLVRITEPSASENGDTLGAMSLLEDGRSLLQSKLKKALLDPITRSIWLNTSFSYIYGDRNSWFVPVAIQGIRQLMKEANNPNLKINFKIIKDANHLVMWDDPELALRTLAECLEDI